MADHLRYTRNPLLLPSPRRGRFSEPLGNQIAGFEPSRVLVVLGAAMLCTFAIDFWQVQVEPDLGRTAEALVRDFFDELQNGDIEGALAYTDLATERLAPDFLQPELIGEDWAVTGIEAVEVPPAGLGWSPGIGVAVTFEFDGSTETGTLAVGSRDGDVRLLFPLNPVGVDGLRTMREVRVNGQPVEPVNDSFLPLLPGVYDFGTEAGRIAVFPDTDVSPDEATTPADPDEALEAVRAALDAQADRCAESVALTAPECNVDLEGEDDLPSLDSPAEVEWIVAEYLRPKLTPAPGSPSVLHGNTETDGAFTITGTADYRDTPDAPKHRHPFHVSCIYTIVSFGPVIAPDGTVGFLETHRPISYSICELID